MKLPYAALLTCALLAAPVALTACGEDASPATNNGQTSNNNNNNNNNNGGPIYQKPDGSACGQAGRTGVTDCQASPNGSCPAGQFCDSVQLTCTVGCNSDVNCADNQYCDIGQDGAGVCRNCVIYTPPAPDMGTTPDMSTTPDMPTNPQTGPCDDGGAEIRACGASAADTAQFIAICKQGLADPDFKPAIEATLSCIAIAADCAEQEECFGDEDPIDPNDPNDPGMDNECDVAATKATTCLLMDAAEAAAFTTSCKQKEAAGLADDLAFCLAGAPTCEAADLCFF